MGPGTVKLWSVPLLICFLATKQVDLLYHMRPPRWPPVQTNKANSLWTFKAVSQNTPYLFISWLISDIYYCDRKLTNTLGAVRKPGGSVAAQLPQPKREEVMTLLHSRCFETFGKLGELPTLTFIEPEIVPFNLKNELFFLYLGTDRNIYRGMLHSHSIRSQLVAAGGFRRWVFCCT